MTIQEIVRYVVYKPEKYSDVGMGKFTKTLCISERKEYHIMEGPIITVDVSKGSCHYQPFIENGHPMRKPKQLSATNDGFQKLGQTIKDLEAKTERGTASVHTS